MNVNCVAICTQWRSQRGRLREGGGGGSKKDAKREAAQKMIDKLKSMGPNNSPAQVRGGVPFVKKGAIYMYIFLADLG